MMVLPVVVVVAAVGGLGGSPAANATTQALGLPGGVLSAYEQASNQIGSHFPGCSVPWWVLAGVGKVEWTNGQGRTVDATGEVSPPVLGPLLDGTNGTQAIALPDGSLAQALGPMQVTPDNWKALGIRASADGQLPDPQNLGDASLTAALMLCRAAGGGDLSDPARLQAAAHGYNPGGGQGYVDAVVSAAAYYRGFASTGSGLTAAGLYALPVTSTYLTDVVLRSLHHRAQDGTPIPAIDIPMPEGTPIFAVMGGLASPTTDAACGTGVRIVGDDGYEYVFCHGSALVGITPGGRVGTGQPIMLSGSTGDATGPHLHFQIKTPTGQLICPGPYLQAWLGGVPMPPSEGRPRRARPRGGSGGLRRVSGSSQDPK
jgi:hypothetical protein